VPVREWMSVNDGLWTRSLHTGVEMIEYLGVVLHTRH
jgi:hypothetical protein